MERLRNERESDIERWDWYAWLAGGHVQRRRRRRYQQSPVIGLNFQWKGAARRLSFRVCDGEVTDIGTDIAKLRTCFRVG